MNLDFAKSVDRIAGSMLGSFVGAADALTAPWRALGPVDHVERVLVVKFWGLGNWALLRPIVVGLRERYPGARLTIATLDANRALVSDLADDVLIVRTGSVRSTVRDLAAAVRFLRQRPHQLSLDFEQFSRAGTLLCRLGGVAQRIGFASGTRGRDRLYTVTVPFRTDQHVTRNFRNVAEAGGLSAAPYRTGALFPDPDAVASLTRRFGSLEGAVVIHPGSGDNFPGRRWSPAAFQAVGRAAAARGARVVVTGGASEVTLAARIADGASDGAQSLAGVLSLPELIALLSGAAALVSNDTGPVHIASQLGIPVLAIFGPNTPVLYGPLSEGSQSFYRSLPCSPCLTNASYRSSRCRIFTCMDAIPTGAVVSALDRLLERRRVLQGGGS